MDPDPYSQTAQDPTQQQGLLQILQQIQAIQNRPLIPDNPLSQLGAALQGASAGYAGQPNPAIQQAMAQRQQQLSGLTQTAGVLGHIGMLQHQKQQMDLATLRETRQAAHETRTAGQAGKEFSLKFAQELMKVGQGPAMQKGFELLNEVGQLGLSPEQISLYAQGDMLKKMPEGIALASHMLDAGVDPTPFVKLPPDLTARLKAMSPEERAAIQGPDAAQKAAQAAKTLLESKIAQIQFDRVQAGLPKEPPKSFEEMATGIVDRMNNDPRFIPSQQQQDYVKMYLMEKNIKGLVSKEALAYRALVYGDADAKKVYDALSAEEKGMTDVKIGLQAAQERLRMMQDPTYVPPTAGKVALLYTDQKLEQKDARVMPPVVQQRMIAARTALGRVGVVQEIMKKPEFEAWIGRVQGPIGKMIESTGIAPSLSNPDRIRMQTEMAALFAESNPELIGTTWTVNEMAIRKEFQAEMTNPSPQFKGRFTAMVDMLKRKYADQVSSAKANHYHMPEDWNRSPLDPMTGGMTSTQKAIRDAKDAHPEWSPQQVKQYLQSRGYQ